MIFKPKTFLRIHFTVSSIRLPDVYHAKNLLKNIWQCSMQSQSISKEILKCISNHAVPHLRQLNEARLGQAKIPGHHVFKAENCLKMFTPETYDWNGERAYIRGKKADTSKFTILQELWKIMMGSWSTSDVLPIYLSLTSLSLNGFLGYLFMISLSAVSYAKDIAGTYRVRKEVEEEKAWMF